MATLTSPGVAVSVIDESFYVPADAGTTPLFIVASAQDKTAGSGSSIASGTQTTNANNVYLITSQRELTETFGDPKFYTDASGNSLNGYELNEYGLQAAYSFLGIANRAYVLRANIDLADLMGSSSAPTSRPSILSLASPFAVRSITGVSRFFLFSSINSNPFFPGIIISSTIKSNFIIFILSEASSALSAVVTK